MIYTRESDFEDDVVAVLQQHGWKDGVLMYPTERDLLDNWANILYENNAGRDRLNGQRLTGGEMRQILEKIETLRTPLALNSFINGKTVVIKRENPADTEHYGKEVSLKIYDRREIAAGQSRYQIARQPKYAANDPMLSNRRGDLCLLINGMPVIHIELKKSGVPVSQACNQIEKYSHEGIFSGIFRLVQIFVAMNPDDAVYFANPGQDAFNPSFFFHWADFNNEPIAAGANPGAGEWKKFTSKLLSIPMAHQLIGFYTVADNSDGALKVLRSYQYYAASAISDRVRTCEWDEPVPTGTPGRLGGYVWHTTGSGKTMTSFKSAQLIADSKDADKVVFLMDRIELGTQSLREYRAFADNRDDVQGTENTAELIEKMSSGDPKNTLIVTSIQKMSNITADGEVTQAWLDRMAGRRIVFIIDECHRSTFGDMLQDIRRSFPNALYFGFTGTPIHEENRKKDATTAMVFGDCLHRYSIADGIRDGNVLGFDTYMVTTYRDRDVRQQVALARAKAATPEDAYADPGKSKVFDHYMNPAEVPMGPMETLAGERIKGIEDYLPASQYAQNTPHVAKVIEDIIDQFPTLSHGNKFHALLATSSIPEAINYYRRLKREAPGLKVTALFDPSIDNNGGAAFKEDALGEIIGDYNAAYGKEFTIPSWPAMKKDISARLAHKKPYVGIDNQREERLDLLIVVDQMLTGFDSKWVNTLYLDKVIDYEGIIQAFSRTNRLCGPDKPFGVIRYYRKPHSMEGYIKAAVKLYSGDRPLDLFVQKLPENLKLMESRLLEMRSVFASDGVEDFVRLPFSVEARRKFAKLFVEFNEFLEAAKVQGFTWGQREYTVRNGEGETVTVCPPCDERTYLVLLQRYKELFDGSEPLADGGEPESPYELRGYLTEIDTGRIDTDYMNANFVKWLKALNEGEDEPKALEELHRSFASLSQQEQQMAELFLHDVQRGDVAVDPNKTFRDYITEYAHREKDTQVDKLVGTFGLDDDLLREMMSLDLNEANLNEYARFDKLKASVDKGRMSAYFNNRESGGVSEFTCTMLTNKLLKQFILEGGFDIDEWDSHGK